MKRDFGLEVELPNDRLCPGVPNRLNYLLWLHQLLSTSSPYDSAPDREITGLDIGTGASAIYPLLGCATNPTWSFLATDIDSTSLAYAKRNIENNNLAQRIRLIPSTTSGPLIPLHSPKGDINTLDFVICNPPFYSSASDLQTSAEKKSKPPNSACTGSPNEMVTPGGEVAFVSRMIGESLVLWVRVQWYTSMVGLLSSLKPLIQRLQTEGCTNWAVGELVQGNKTRRWVLGWSWQGWRPSMSVARGVGSSTLEKKYLPFPGEYKTFVSGCIGGVLKETKERLDRVIGGMCIRWEWNDEKGNGVGFTRGDVWSRAARRRGGDGKIPLKANKEQKRRKIAEDDPTSAMAFGFRLLVTEIEGNPGRENRTEVEVIWIKGDDSVLFESFCGMVNRIAFVPDSDVKRKAGDTMVSDVAKKTRQ